MSILKLWHWIEKAVFGTLVGRILAAVVAGWVTWWGWLNFVHDPKVKREVVSEINRSGEQLASAAEAARQSASTPGAWGRLLKNSCRDCQ